MKRSATLFLSLLMFTACGANAIALSVRQSKYTIRDLGDSYRVESFIDDRGNVATIAYENEQSAPVIISPDGTRRLVQPFGDDSVHVEDYNNGGQMLTWSAESDVLWDASGHSTVLDGGYHQGAMQWSAFGPINNRGSMAVAHWRTYYGSSRYLYEATAFVFRPNGSKVQLANLPGHACSIPTAINDSGWVVGIATTKEWTPYYGRAVAWAPNGTITQLRTDPGDSGAVAISNFGEIAGNTASGPVVWDTRGKVRRKLLCPPGATSSSVTDINDGGIAIGTADGLVPDGSSWASITRAVVWDTQGRPTYLDRLPGHISCWADHINNAGQIVGWSQPDDLMNPYDNLVVWTPK